MDYRELLKQYMSLVLEEEGVTFVEHMEWSVGDVAPGISEEHKAELRKIHAEITGKEG